MSQTKGEKSAALRAGGGKDKSATGRAALAAQILSTLEPLTNAQRTAFLRLFSAAKCDEFGAKTKSAAVVKDAVEWAPIIAKALGKCPADLRRYGKARFAWLLECILALVDARAAQEAEGEPVPAVRAGAARAVEAAKDARAELVDALETLHEGDAPALKVLATAAAAVRNDDEALADSVQAVATLARGWLGRMDAESRALVASVGLTLGEVESAENAAATLAASVGATTLAGRLDFRDSPVVNRAEGRVLCEMRTAMRLFASAHDRNKLVPKLAPGAGTRHVLGKHPTVAKDAGTPDAPVPDALVPTPAA